MLPQAITNKVEINEKKNRKSQQRYNEESNTNFSTEKYTNQTKTLSEWLISRIERTVNLKTEH